MRHLKTFRLGGAVLLCLTLLLSAAHGLWGANDRETPLHFQQYWYRQGFPQTWVNCIFKDSRGFMWFGTQDGITRYDGYDFHVFHSGRGKRGPSATVIYDISEDPQGNLWFAAMAGLDKFDPDTQTFSHYPVTNTRPDLPASTVVFAVCASKEHPGTIWAGTMHGLLRFDTASETFATDGAFTRFAGSSFLIPINKPLREKDGRLCFVNPAGGVAEYDLKKQLITVIRNDSNGAGRNSARVDQIHFSRTEPVLWILRGLSLEKYHLRERTFTNFPISLSGTRTEGRRFSGLIESVLHPGVLWCGTNGEGLVKVDTRTGGLTRFRYDPERPESICSDAVFSLYQDPQGLLWVGSVDKGFCKQQGHRTFLTHRPSTSRAWNANEVTSVYQSPTQPDTVWFGMPKRLYRFARRDKSITLISFNGNRRLKGNIFGLTGSSTQPGVLWFVTPSDGLCRYNYHTGTLRTYRDTSAARTGYNDLYNAPSTPGKLWMGAGSNNITVFDIREGTFSTFPLKSARPADIMGVIYHMYESPAVPGTLWIATSNSGLLGFDMKNRGNSISLGPGPDSLPMGRHFMFHIFESPAAPGILWLGTAAGLVKFDGVNRGKLEFPGEGLFKEELVSAIRQDQQGNLWLATGNRGLIRFSPATGEMKRFDIRDGLLGNRFNRAVTQRPDGEIFFGSRDGFVHFYPREIKGNPYVPPVVFSDFLLGNRRVTIGEKGKGNQVILEKDINRAGKVALSYKDDTVFSIRFAALNFIQTVRNRYAYKLEEYDSQWRDAGTRRSATYTGVPHGSYQFRVKACNNDGVWNETGRSLVITITPPWWKQTWAVTLGIVLIGLYILWLLRWQRRKLVKKEREKAILQQAELRARAAEAQSKVIESEHRRKTGELEEARRLQLSLLPKTLPRVHDLEIAVHMNTATEVGGDYYDFFLGEDDAFTVAVGDATGHGLKAGTMVTIIKSLFMSQRVLLKQDIPTFLHQASGAVKQMQLGNLFMALTILRIEDNHIAMGAGGMPPLYHFRARDGKVVSRLIKAPPLGAFRSYYYRRETFEWEPGDVLLLVSDGLPEAFDPQEQMFGYGRVGQLLEETGRQSPQKIIDGLVKAADDWFGKKAQDDDITFVVLKKKQ